MHKYHRFRLTVDGPRNAETVSADRPTLHPDIAKVAETRKILAAEYVRMSTGNQKYSTENQVDRIRQYADKRGMEIVKTYAGEGKSGLRIKEDSRGIDLELGPMTASQPGRPLSTRANAGRQG